MSLHFLIQRLFLQPLKLTLEAQVTTRSEVFHYNGTFGEAASNASNAAWSELFPKQGGFFKHPTIAPQRSAFAVFHQLHCLVRNVDVEDSVQTSDTSGTLRMVYDKAIGPFTQLP